MTNSDTKTLIETAKTFEQADNVLSRTWCKTEADKLEYLRQLFPERFHDEFVVDDIHEEYVSIVMSIIHGATNESFQYGYREGMDVGLRDGQREIVRHIIKEWADLRNLSEAGIKNYFARYLHLDIEDIQREYIWKD